MHLGEIWANGSIFVLLGEAFGMRGNDKKRRNVIISHVTLVILVHVAGVVHFHDNYLCALAFESWVIKLGEVALHGETE